MKILKKLAIFFDMVTKQTPDYNWYSINRLPHWALKRYNIYARRKTLAGMNVYIKGKHRIYKITHDIGPEQGQYGISGFYFRNRKL